jgi:Putative TM nitroreductase
VVNDKSVIEIIKQRYSCRTYQERPIDDVQQQAISDFLSVIQKGPFGNPLRFEMVAAKTVGMGTQVDRRALKGLGTYGTLHNVPGFIVGVVATNEKNKANNRDMEDYGYWLEEAILFAKAIGLDTCWLGGFFTRSSFSRAMGVKPNELIPAVAAIGYAMSDPRTGDVIRMAAGSNRRFSWEKLFFQNDFSQPISVQEAGAYAEPLEMVRLAPSASNKQPWRIIREGNAWHFYLQRTPGYGGGLVSLFLSHADLQQVDIGIAMCHFDLTAAELGLKGTWEINEPRITRPDNLTEYIATWIGSQGDNGG